MSASTARAPASWSSLSENPLINRVAFEGNTEVKSDTLSQEVQLKARSMYSRASVQADVQRILDVYRRQGYYATQVDAQIIELDANRVDLVFEIREGPETKVVGINFIGNQAFSDTELRGVITTTESELSRLFETDFGLRSRPLQPRSRASPPVLHQKWLRGYESGVGRG